VEQSPDLLLQPAYGALAAAWFGKSRGLNELADAACFAGITRRINGSLDGLADREIHWRRAQAAI
jgi:putative chitinase